MRDRGFSAVIGTLVIVTITILIAIIVVSQLAWTFTTVLDDDQQALAGVTVTEQPNGDVRIQVVSLQQGTNVYVRATNASVDGTTTIDGRNRITGSDMQTDVTDDCIVRNVSADTRVVVVAENGDAEQLITTYDG